MAHFSIAHIVRLRDGTYAVLSADYPQCEGRDIQAWPAREKFRAALSEQVHALIGEGELPPGLCLSLEEAQAAFDAQCRTPLEVEDRQPQTSDYAVIVDFDLSAAEAERFAKMRAHSRLPESRL